MFPEIIRERLLRDPLPQQLGALASDLARIASCSDSPANQDVVASLLKEGKYFCEWIAPGAPLDTQVVLLDIQRALVQWERGWLRGEPVATMRADAARKSEELLALAGLGEK